MPLAPPYRLLATPRPSKGKSTPCVSSIVRIMRVCDTAVLDGAERKVTVCVCVCVCVLLEEEVEEDEEEDDDEERE